MKRLLALVLVGVMSLELFGCGKKDSGSGKNRDEDDKPKATTEEVEDDEYGDDSGIGFSQKGEKTAFSVSADIELTQGAWMGFIPGTKGYKDEEEADEYDVLYTYIENPEKKDSEDYIFQFDNDSINALDDGDYIIVLCDDDDNGKVILYIPAVIKGSKVTCDFDKIVIN